jgi:hypothetical protein
MKGERQGPDAMVKAAKTPFLIPQPRLKSHVHI